MQKWIVKQQDIQDCGACCLLSIIKYYGGFVPLETLRENTYTDKTGTSAYNLIETFKRYGFEAAGLKAQVTDLRVVNLPAIAHVLIDGKLPHFVVVYKINKKNITMMDPGKGVIKMRLTDFNKIFLGTIIISNPINKIISIDKPKSIYYLFKDIYSLEKSLIIKIILISLILTTVGIASSFYLKYALNSLNKLDVFLNINETVLIFGIIYLIKIFTTYVRNYFKVYLTKNIDIHLTIPFLKHLFNIPLNNLKSRSTGDIVERVDELNNVKELFSDVFIFIFLDCILALSTLIILININLNLTLITCGMLIVYGIFGFMISPTIKKKAEENIDLETQYKSSLIESISGIQSIKNLNKSNYFLNKLIVKLIIYLRQTFKISHLFNKYNLVKDIINELGTYAILTLGIFLIKDNALSIIDIMVFTSLVTYLNNPIKNIIDYLPKIEFIKASFNKINDFINFPRENLCDDDHFHNGDISINNLRFSYNGQRSIINNLNLAIKKGEKVVLSGTSGSGKSTLCKLIIRMMKYDAGEILISNVNIEDYNLQTIRNNICYISQDEILFSDTIKSNILLNNNPKELQKVLNICQIEDILKTKPFRLETFLLEQGSNLSGGEKQRLILARGLMCNCPIIILDEALSEVSKSMEETILENIIKHYRDRTIIYVSHHTTSNLFERIIKIEECYE